MSYNSTVLGVWTFNQTLEDSVLTNDFVSSSGLSTNYTRFRKYSLFTQSFESKYGLAFDEDTSLSAGYNFSFDTSGLYIMTLGFIWYYPEVLGFVRHSVTRKLQPKIAPIIAKANSSISGGVETVDTGEWIVSEMGYSDTMNVIRLALCSTGGTPTHIYYSTPYLPGIHHVFITYYDATTSSLVRIEIDGASSSHFVGPFGGSGLSSTVAELRINDIGFGPTAHKTNQDGAYIADLILRAKADYISDDSIRMMRYGWEYIADNDLMNKKFWFFGASYSQPSTITTTNILPEGSDILVGRTDGTILKGIRPLWDVDYHFDSPDLLSLLLPQDNTKVSIEDSLLKINNTSVRIL